jgi:hypothetical protein
MARGIVFRWGAALALAWLACLAAPLHAAEPLQRIGVVLLQPSSVLEARVPNVDAMAEYIRAVEAAAREAVLASPSIKPAGGFVVIAVRPERQSRVWLDFEPALNFQTGRQIVAKVGALQPFEARSGPVVFALQVSLWGGPAARRVAPSPPEWKAVTQNAGKPLELDALIEQVWRD